MTEEDAIKKLKNYKYHIIKCGNTKSEHFKAVSKLLETVEKQNKQIDITNKYLDLLYGILIDYDGYYDPTTKTGSLEALASLIDETKDTIIKIHKQDTTTPIFSTCHDGEWYNTNILGERLN